MGSERASAVRQRYAARSAANAALLFRLPIDAANGCAIADAVNRIVDSGGYIDRSESDSHEIGCAVEALENRVKKDPSVAEDPAVGQVLSTLGKLTPDEHRSYRVVAKALKPIYRVNF